MIYLSLWEVKLISVARSINGANSFDFQVNLECKMINVELIRQLSIEGVAIGDVTEETNILSWSLLQFRNSYPREQWTYCSTSPTHRYIFVSDFCLFYVLCDSSLAYSSNQIVSNL